MVEGKGDTILIIEDEPGVARLQRRRLERAGYTVVSAETAEEGMDKLDQGGVKLILLDYRLPGNLTGLDVYEQIKTAGHDLPVIMVTGFSDEATVIRALRAGVRDFVTKSPEYLSYLPEAVQRVLKSVQTEQQLAQSEARLAGIINSARDAILTVDADQHITLFNEAAEKIFRSPAAAVLGKSISHLIPSISEATPLRLKPSLTRDNHSATWSELEGVRADGEKFPLEASISQANVEDEEFSIVIAREITEKKRLEAQFLRAQRMESIGTLAGGIAHDLNNVLSPILMAAELLQRLFPDETRQMFLDPIRTSAQRGADMVKQILAFARGVEGQRIELQLKHVLRDVEQMLQHALPKSIELRTSLPRDLWTVSGDATQLHQVFMNLCVNARDAMPGSGQLTIGAKNISLDESTARSHIDAVPGPYVVVTVADTGTGIPAGFLDKIFDPFFTTKEPGKGTGLGLSTSLGIIKSHGGFITVDTGVGKGTCFSVHLPAVPACRLQRTEEPDRPLPCGNGELILVVDDEASIRAMTQGTLEAHGYRVLTASDGAEAVALYRSRQVSIQAVLTDMMMPVMAGGAVIAALQKLDPQVLIIAASGLLEQSESTSAATMGVQALLTKPYTLEKLLTTLAAVLHSAWTDTGSPIPITTNHHHSNGAEFVEKLGKEIGAAQATESSHASIER